MAEPQTPGRTRAWLWVLGGLVVVLAIALVVVLVTRSDDSDEADHDHHHLVDLHDHDVDDCSDHHDRRAAATTTVALPVITDDPQTYAEYLFAAWQNGNRTAAAEVASADAVTQMFAQPYPAKGPYTFANCGPAAGSLYCTWNGQDGATIQMTVRTLTGGLPVQVQSVQFSP